MHHWQVEKGLHLPVYQQYWLFLLILQPQPYISRLTTNYKSSGSECLADIWGCALLKEIKGSISYGQDNGWYSPSPSYYAPVLRRHSSSTPQAPIPYLQVHFWPWLSSCCLLSRPPLPSFCDAPSPVLNHTHHLQGYTHIFNLYITKGKWKIRALHFNLIFLFQWTSQDAERLTQTSMLEVGDDTFTLVCHSQKPFYHWIALAFWLLRMPLL